MKVIDGGRSQIFLIFNLIKNKSQTGSNELANMLIFYNGDGGSSYLLQANQWLSPLK